MRYLKYFHRKCTITRIAWAIYGMKQEVYITIFVSENLFYILNSECSQINKFTKYLQNRCRTEKISRTIIRVGMIITAGLEVEPLDMNDPVNHQRTLLLQVVVVEQDYRAEDDQLVHILHHIPRVRLICRITPPGVEYNCQPGRQFTVAFLSNSTANYLKTLFPISKLKKISLPDKLKFTYGCNAMKS